MDNTGTSTQHDVQSDRVGGSRIGVVIAAAVLLFIAGYAVTAPPPPAFENYKPGRFLLTRADTILWYSYMDVDTLGLFAASRRIIDSLIDARAGASIREEIAFRFTANFSNNANDSINLMVNNAFQVIQLPYNLYADRVTLETDKPGKDGPTSFRDDLPRVGSSDSLLILRLSRNSSFASGQKIGITLYKVARGTGLSFGNTVGVFYDMIRFDEGEFKAAGNSTQLSLLLTLKKNR